MDAARRASALRGLRARFPCVPAAADSPDGAAASSEPFFESHPSLYPRGSRHGPRHRTDTLLAASLKLGAFNTLALLVVAWSAMLGPALPILFSVGPPLRGAFARDFLCNEAFRDARALLKLLALVVAWAASPWLLVRAHCAGLINPAALVVCHFAALATLAGAAAAVLLVGHQLAPLYGMQGGLLCVIAALKAHSFVFTHLAPLKAPPAPVPQAPPPSAAAYVYFMLAPTLCWEARGFPTAKRVRWAHAVGWLACAVGAASAQYFVLREMLLPVLTEEPTVAAAFPALPGVFAAAAAFFVDLARLAVPSLFFWRKLQSCGRGATSAARCGPPHALWAPRPTPFPAPEPPYFTPTRHVQYWCFLECLLGGLICWARSCGFPITVFIFPCELFNVHIASPTHKHLLTPTLTPTPPHTHIHAWWHTRTRTTHFCGAVVDSHVPLRVLAAVELARAPLVRAAPPDRRAGVPLCNTPWRRGHHLFRVGAAA